jgi:serpin B
MVERKWFFQNRNSYKTLPLRKIDDFRGYLQSMGSSIFGNILADFRLQVTREISTIVYFPRYLNRKSAQKNPKIDRTLLCRHPLRAIFRADEFYNCFKKQLFIFLTCSLFTLSLQADDNFPRSCRYLAIDAYHDRSSDGNWLFSPLSASACLSMVYAGSNGKTANELREALLLDLSPEKVGLPFHAFLKSLNHRNVDDRDFRLTIVQGIWGQTNFPFLDCFISSMRENFQARIESIDFSPSSTDQINLWIADQTEHKIENLLNPGDIDSSTKLLLANAIYFKGNWINRFQPSHTHIAVFTNSAGVKKDVEMMQQSTHFQYFEDSDWQVVLLPFETTRADHVWPACILLLPKHSEAPLRFSVAKFEQILSSCERRLVHLQVPKFRFEERFDLQDWLMRLGVRDSFSMEADFSKMDGRQDLYLSKVVQKCFFSLNEQGVEAAAATAAAMNMKCCAPSAEVAVDWIADRPFEFILIDQNSQTCLMLGHVEDPLE